MTSVFTVSFQKLFEIKYLNYQGIIELKNNLVTIPCVESLSRFCASTTSGKYLCVRRLLA